MRSSSVAFIVVSILGASSARADVEPVPSCETVTTVRCTGSAAALALPGATAPPAAPAPVVEQAPAAPRLGNSEDCCAPSAPIAPTLPSFGLPDGWKLGRDEHGELYAEIKRRAPRASIWAPGLVLWITSYLGTAIGGGVNDGNVLAAIPLIGGMVSAISYGVGGDDGSLGRIAGYTLGTLVQVGGFVTFLVGLSAGEKYEQLPVKLSPFGVYGQF